MQIRILAAAAVLALTAATGAGANLATNGSFETGYVQQTGFGASFPSGVGPTGWTSANSNAFNLYMDPTTATTTETVTRFGELGQKLSNAFTGASPDGGKFVVLDGDTGFNGALTQVINGLTIGAQYSVSFYWAATQLQNRTGDTTERLDVTFGGVTQSTPTVANPSQGFQGWFSQAFTFTATSTSDVLSFLSVGSPNGLPPVALLDGVNVSAVPEPATWGMLIAGFVMVGAAARRRRPMAVAA